MGVLKGSIFNHNIMLENKELLVYNSLTKSLCKYNSEISGEVESYLINGVDIQTSRNKIIDDLENRSLLVPEDYDEKSISDYIYMQEVMGGKLELTLLPTNKCNFRCPYCYEDHEDITMSKELQDAIIKYVRRNIKNYTGLSVAWFGGEATEELGIMEYLSTNLMEICKKRNKEYSSGITSNAYNLTPDVFEKLLSWKIRDFHITIDGIKEVHDSQRFKVDGSGTFDTIIENLINMKEMFKNKRFTVVIRTNISGEVYKKLEEYLNFMSERFADDERFQFYFRTVNDWGGDHIKDFAGTLLKGSEIEKVYDKIADLKVPLNYFIGQDILGSRVCYAGKKNHYMIDSDGVIKKCTCDTNSEVNKIGKMNSDGTMELDINKEIKWVKLPNAGKCDKCKMNPICHGRSCAKEAAFGRQPSCSLSKGEIEAIIKAMYATNSDINNVEIEVL